MAKKKTAEKSEPKVVTKCDNLNAVSPAHDKVVTSVAQSIPEGVSIKSMIRVIRGQQVMLDSDLAFLYGVETRRLNEQVKRNIERFPSDFMFQLTKEEVDFLKSQFAMSNIADSQDKKNLKSQIAISRWGGTRKLPYAFTRNGVAMLSSVLRSQTAVGVNIKIMRVFTAILGSTALSSVASLILHGNRKGWEYWYTEEGKQLGQVEGLKIGKEG